MKMQYSTKYRKRRVSSPLIGLAVIAGGMVAPLFTAISPAYAASTTLYLSPSSANVTVNTNFTVGVRINAGESVNAVEANLTYNASQLQFVSISDSGSAFGINASQGGGDGSVTINRGQIGGVTGDKLVASVTFKALASNVSSAVSFAGSSQALRNSDSSNALSGTSGGSYALKAVAVSTPTAKPPAASPTPSSAKPTPASPTTPATPPTASTPPAAPTESTPAPNPAVATPKTKDISGSASSDKATVWGLSGLAVLLIGAVAGVMFFRRRKAVLPLNGVQATVMGPSVPSQSVAAPGAPGAIGSIVTPTGLQPSQSSSVPVSPSSAIAPASPAAPAAPVVTPAPAQGNVQPGVTAAPQPGPGNVPGIRPKPGDGGPPS